MPRVMMDYGREPILIIIARPLSCLWTEGNQIISRIIIMSLLIRLGIFTCQLDVIVVRWPHA
ncbi:hypothetical protein BDZ94DRAFT_437415 [Collybia nuda]|uniref:Uncharacterized protein n=1 Tax=Collybia nuda TaxID=64659 RepID=A0A9P6C8N5_9AGAR|nr:hypothetical protein BDZ94DRAFT_437415 [Collybia nuda]